ncbi:HvfC/BufC family peptide modification chaperone [Shewanella sp.]|uniref:HvfC/BufC family peptide modification chaperone n=1 Tax=Shewanella sp. TaxID=50422 RepID=UPI0040544CAB
MSELANLQQQFMDYLLSADPNSPTASEPAVTAFQARIVNQHGISADVRMQIYANAYRMRLKETMETDHQMLGLYLGDELFDKLALEYTQAHPSRFRSLREFCDALPDFLQQDAFFGQYPILADLARFERRLLNAFDAADSQRSSFAELQGIAPEHWPSCRLRFHPSVQIFICNSNAVESWQALKQAKTPPTPEYQSRRAWLLWRGTGRLTEFISLTEEQLLLLQGFIRGENFASQCELMLEFHDEQLAPMKVLQALQAWFSMGIIRSVEVS